MVSPRVNGGPLLELHLLGTGPSECNVSQLVSISFHVPQRTYGNPHISLMPRSHFSQRLHSPILGVSLILTTAAANAVCQL